ncbi:MAG: hypothetical protein HY420_04505 [Candidatus Kerfeldbacteria bacterium]|nr:hypothetical protein [Candidatus Kerfeldbacteria bacterium]
MHLQSESHVNYGQLYRTPGRLLQRVAAGESIVLCRYGEPMALLTPMPSPSPARQFKALTVTQLSRDAARCVWHANGGQHYQVIRHGRPIARLIPFGTTATERLRAIARS